MIDFCWVVGRTWSPYYYYINNMATYSEKIKEVQERANDVFEVCVFVKRLQVIPII